MIKDELESKDITARVMPEDLFKEDKNLLFDTKEHNDLCSRWWRKGQTAHPKVIILLDVKS